jgi:hypothetical protein
MLKEEYLRSQSRPRGPFRNYSHAWTVDPQDEGAKFCRGRACPARSGRTKRRPYLLSFPRRRESRLDPGSESGGDGVGLDSVHTINIDQNKRPNL